MGKQMHHSASVLLVNVPFFNGVLNESIVTSWWYPQKAALPKEVKSHTAYFFHTKVLYHKKY